MSTASPALAPPVRVLVLGATGMLGSAVFNTLAADARYNVMGTVRSRHARRFFSEHIQDSLIDDVDADNPDSVSNAFAVSSPDVAINCIGIIKHLNASNDPLSVLPVNSLLPHRLAKLCAIAGARFIHISTDCVYDGAQGAYLESDQPNASDLYGVSKALGEVAGDTFLTIRTSIIGPELTGKTSLLEWFLAQHGIVPGYSKAIFSGLPTVELAEVLRDYVVPYPRLCGLYHVSSDPISKYSLLSLIQRIYKKHDVILEESDKVIIDRSLDSTKFRRATGYTPPDWTTLVHKMYNDHQMLR